MKRINRVFVIMMMFVVCLLLLNCSNSETTPVSSGSEIITHGYTNTLVFNGHFTDNTDGVDGLDGALFVVVSPDNKNVYVTGRFDASLAVFSRDPSTGYLNYIESFKDGEAGVDGLSEVRTLAISPDGKNIYVAGRDDNSITIFNRNTTTGALTYSASIKDDISGVDGLDGAHGVTVSPDNKNVYVASIDDNSLAVFNRDPATGALTYSTCFKDGVDGVDGLEYAIYVVVSPDNKNVYVCANSDNSLAVFNRDTTTGALTYSTCFKDGVGGVDGLDSSSCVVVSPDNKNVYVASVGDDALVVFNRDPATGALTYTTNFKNNINGVAGLNGAIAVTVSPDNKTVFVAGNNSASVAVFNRDTATGSLSFYTSLTNQKNWVQGIDSVRDVTVTPDGKHLYVTGRDSDSLAVFSVIRIYGE